MCGYSPSQEKNQQATKIGRRQLPPISATLRPQSLTPATALTGSPMHGSAPARSYENPTLDRFFLF
jgi:hypothetical protein